MKTLVANLYATSYNGKQKKSSVWLIGLKEPDIDTPVVFFDNLDDFFKTIQEVGCANIYFHNLARFQQHFLRAYWKRKDYQVVSDDKTERTKKRLVATKNEGRYITVYYDKDNQVIHNFIDSQAYIEGSLDDYAEHMGITLVPPRKIFEGQKVTITDQDKDSMSNDVQVLTRTLQEFRVFECFENGLASRSQLGLQTVLHDGPQITLARLDGFRAHVKYKGKHSREWSERGFEKRTTYERVVIRKPKGLEFIDEKGRSFRKRVPNDRMIAHARRYARAQVSDQLREEAQRYADYLEYRSMKQLTAQTARDSYTSGWNYLNPEKRNVWIDKLGITLDENSLHPKNYSSKPLPNEVIATTRDKKMLFSRYKDCYYFVKVKNFQAELTSGKPIIRPRKDDRVIQEHQKQVDREKTPTKLFLKRAVFTMTDWEYIQEHYNIQNVEDTLYIVYSRHYELEKKLRKHVDYWYLQKSQNRKKGDTFATNFAKFMLVTPTGALGVKRDATGSNDIRSDVAVASAINAYGRVGTAEMANRISDKYFCYSSVDSIHMILPDEWLTNGQYDEKKTIQELEKLGFYIDAEALGAWKIERVWSRAKFFAPNLYGELDVDKGWTTVISGLTGSNNVPMERFESGQRLEKLDTVPCEGGAVQIDIGFELP